MHRWFLVAFILSVAAFRLTGLWVASPRAVSIRPISEAEPSLQGPVGASRGPCSTVPSSRSPT